MATYRGSDGAFFVAGTATGELQSWTVDTDRPELDTTAMGDTAGTYDLDVGSWTASAVANFDYSDAQQAALVAQAVAGTVPAAIAAQFRLSATKYLGGNVLVRSVSVGAARGSNVSATFNLRGTGALTVTWS